MKIHIIGASGAGSTTLGMALARMNSMTYFDTDHYFWEPAEVPFTIRRDAALRNRMLAADLSANEHWILGGSLLKWGEPEHTEFDLVIFLYIPPELRLQRLRDREFARYGNIIVTDPERALLYRNFMEWAKGYDDGTAFSGRSLKAQEHWLHQLNCPVLEIRGDTTIAERLELAQQKIAELRLL